MDLTLQDKVDMYISWLLEKKAGNIIPIDVRDKCSFTEFIIVCTGTATLHNKSIADYVLEKLT